MYYHPAEVLIVDGIIAAQRGSVEIEDSLLVGEIMIIGAEVVHQVGKFAPVLDVEGLHHVQTAACFVRLSHGQAVDVGIKIERNAKRAVGLQVSVHAAVHHGKFGHIVA